MKLAVSEKEIKLYEQDLWKDARKLELESSSERDLIRRYSDYRTSLVEEYRFIRRLVDQVSFKIPSVFDHSEASISFEYIIGTRAFNLLIDLRTLYYRENNSLFFDLADQLIGLLADDLRDFQQCCKSHPEWLASFQLYPAREKLFVVYSILKSVLGLETDLSELEEISRLFDKKAELPFRDATTKNVILKLPDLYKKRFDSYQDRLECIRQQAHSGELKKRLHPSVVYHIDFSGCCYLCPEEDDWIALRRHEASAWVTQNRPLRLDEVSTETLATQFVRFSRFGGRKLAYRLLNSDGYRVRFKFDSEGYYFERLAEICAQLAQRGVLAKDNLEPFMLNLKEATNIQPEKDYFQEWKKDLDAISYYTDVFPT